jgi:hypothetical protein
MSQTKSQVMARIIAGQAFEAFQHQDLGLFDVTRMRRAAQSGEYGETYQTGLLPEIAQHLMTARDYDQMRVWELLIDPSAPWQNDPALAVFDPKDNTHLFVDGTHRILGRWMLKLPDFEFYVCQLADVIYVPADYGPVNDSWGQPDFVERNRR